MPKHHVYRTLVGVCPYTFIFLTAHMLSLIRKQSPFQNPPSNEDLGSLTFPCISKMSRHSTNIKSNCPFIHVVYSTHCSRDNIPPAQTTNTSNTLIIKCSQKSHIHIFFYMFTKAMAHIPILT
jgi:hypothetical protein